MLTKSNTLIISAVTAGVLLCSTSAFATSQGSGLFGDAISIAAGAHFTNNYVWRGVSQTDNGPAMQGYFDLKTNFGLTVGAWGSNVNFVDTQGDTATTELDYYANFSHDFDKLNVNVGAVRYVYPRANGLDWNEFSAGVGYTFFDSLSTNLSAHFSSDVLGSSERGTYYQLAANYDIPASVLSMQGFSVGGHVGRYNFATVTGLGNYTDYSAYVNKSLTDHVGVGLAWTGTNGGLNAGNADDNHIVASISANI